MKAGSHRPVTLPWLQSPVGYWAPIIVERHFPRRPVPDRGVHPRETPSESRDDRGRDSPEHERDGMGGGQHFLLQGGYEASGWKSGPDTYHFLPAHHLHGPYDSRADTVVLVIWKKKAPA